MVLALVADGPGSFVDVTPPHQPDEYTYDAFFIARDHGWVGVIGQVQQPLAQFLKHLAIYVTFLLPGIQEARNVMFGLGGDPGSVTGS